MEEEFEFSLAFLAALIFDNHIIQSPILCSSSSSDECLSWGSSSKKIRKNTSSDGLVKWNESSATGELYGTGAPPINGEPNEQLLQRWVPIMRQFFRRWSRQMERIFWCSRWARSGVGVAASVGFLRRTFSIFIAKFRVEVSPVRFFLLFGASFVGFQNFRISSKQGLGKSGQLSMTQMTIGSQYIAFALYFVTQHLKELNHSWL